MKKINIAVDGTAGSGKTSTFKTLAKKLGYNFIDTGLMYRAFTRFCISKNIDFSDIQSIKDILQDFDYKVKGDKIFVDNIDISDTLANPDIIENISKITFIKEVRQRLVQLQRDMVKKPGNVMIGRDITSVVLPNAELKIYFDCSLEERAKRRYEQNVKNNINIPYEKTYNDLKLRDESDKNRDEGPLVKTLDSIYIDSTSISLEYIVNDLEEKIKQLIK